MKTLAEYRSFLKCKVQISGVYGFEVEDSEIHPSLKPHQRVGVKWAVRGGRRALFEAFGLGKTRQQLEILRLILKRTGGRGLIVAPLGVRQEFESEAIELGLSIKFVRSIEECQPEGLYITNYETVRDGKLDPSHFVVTSLDEAAILASFGGTKTFREFMRLFEAVKYKFVATATPDPNEYIELLAYADYLGIMDTGQGKTRFFKRDATKADKLTLLPSKIQEWWLWVASWALFLQRPSDFGPEFSDEGYAQPEMTVIHHEVQANHEVAVSDRDGQFRMFRNSALGVTDAAREKRDSLPARILAVEKILGEIPFEHVLLWHDLEAERHAIEATVPNVVSVYGSQRGTAQDLETLENSITGFANGTIQYLAAKPSMFGAGANFQRHCHIAIFCGIGFSFRNFIQAIHRIYRFLQTKPVEIHLVYSESEREVLRILMEKWARYKEQVNKMSEIIREYGLSELALAQALTRSFGCERVEISGEGWQLVNNDSIEEAHAEAGRIPENSIGLVLTSIPFATQYEYTPSYNDFGHSESNEQFFEQMDFLTPQIYRALQPGRIAAIHVKDVCLVGDAGMGKSRLARSILDQAERDGALVLEIDCTPSTGNSPLLPVGVLLRRTARIGPGTPEAETLSAATTLLTRLLGAHEADALTYLAPLFGIRSAPIPLDKTPEQVRAATIATIVAIVRALASQAPLALLCEDLHWADDTTAQVVQEIARNIAELRVMVIVTRWPKPVTPIDMESITATCVTVPVSPLPPATAAELVKLVGGEDLSPERIDAIVGRCGGVPLLLEEVTRSTLELPADGTEIRAARVSDSPVPPELQLVVESRLDRWPELKNIIESASVLGREFSVPLLETMVSDREGVTDVAAALSVFADHGLFAQPEPSGGDRASFRHALIRDAVYETLVSKAYVRGLHSRAADALIAGYLGTPDASPDVLAHHLRIAERLGEAIRIRLTAGDDSFKRGAYVEAKGQCEAAHELIDEVRDKSTVRSDAFRLCVLRGMVGAGVHGYSSDPVALAYSEAQSMFDEATAAGERYPVVRGLATSYLVRGELATAYRYSLDGLKLADESARPDYRIDAMSVLSYTTLYFGRLEDCRSWIDRSLQLYDSEAGSTFRYPVPQDAKTAALALLPTAAWLLGDAVGAEEAINRGLEHVDRLAREFDKALLHAWTAGTRYTQRRYLDGIRHAGIAYALGKEHRFQEWEGVGAMMALLCQSALQPAPEAVAQALAVAQEFKSRGVGLNASYFLWGIARGFVTAGNAAAAQATLDAALAVASGSQETRMNPEIWTLKAEIETDRGNAIRMLMDAFALAESQGAIANALRAASALIIRVDPGGGGVEQARAALDRLDGRTPPDPVRPLWMHEDLAQARQVVNGLESAVPRS